MALKMLHVCLRLVPVALLVSAPCCAKARMALVQHVHQRGEGAVDADLEVDPIAAPWGETMEYVFSEAGPEVEDLGVRLGAKSPSKYPKVKGVAGEKWSDWVAGLQVGDQIAEMNNKSTKGMNRAQIDMEMQKRPFNMLVMRPKIKIPRTGDSCGNHLEDRILTSIVSHDMQRKVDREIEWLNLHKQLVNLKSHASSGPAQNGPADKVIYFMRSGYSECSLDAALTNDGMAEARNASLRCPELKDVEVVVTSPSNRHMQTALLAFEGKQVLLDTNLMEIGSYIMDGMGWHTLSKLSPRTLESYNHIFGPYHDSSHSTQVPTFFAADGLPETRFNRFLKMLQARPEKRIAVVSGKEMLNMFVGLGEDVFRTDIVKRELRGTTLSKPMPK